MLRGSFQVQAAAVMARFRPVGVKLPQKGHERAGKDSRDDEVSCDGEVNTSTRASNPAPFA